MKSTYSYQAVLAASEKVNWCLEDVIGGDKRLDFERPFLPRSLARSDEAGFLEAREQLRLNQIRGHEYLYVFGLVEEFILPFVLDHARLHLHGDDHRVRALLRFASEEAKHIHLFKRFREDFIAGFGTPCEVIGPPSEIARSVLAHHPLAVALVVLQIEWMTQRHYSDSVTGDESLDPQFKSLLRHHWMEEAQHAKLDTLMVETLAGLCQPEAIDRAVDEYLEIGGLLEQGLGQQLEMNLDALERVIGRRLPPAQRDELAKQQKQAVHWTFLGSGMSHPNFLATLGALRPAARERVEQLTIH